MCQLGDGGGSPTFTVTPMAVRDGDTVHLTWRLGEVEDGSVQISEAGRALPGVASTEETRELVPATLPTTYRLEWRSRDGSPAFLSRSVARIAPPGAPNITTFRTSRYQIGAGETSVLEWQSSGAQRVTIRANDAEIASSSDAARVAHGFLVVAPSELTTYRLEAQRGSQVVISSLTITVSRPPTGTLTFDPPTLTGAPQLTTAAWSVQDAVRVTVNIHQGDVKGSGASGELEVSPSHGGAVGNIHAELEALGRDGSRVVLHRHAWFVRDEDGGELRLDTWAARAAATPGVWKRFWIKVWNQGGSLRAFVGGPTASCAGFTGFDMKLYDRDDGAPQNLRVKTNEAGCRVFEAIGLDKSDYYIDVLSPMGATGRYVIYAEWHVPACGDGDVGLDEYGAQEACDDGNTINGDGCSAECTLERGASYTPDPTPLDPMVDTEGLTPLDLEVPSGGGRGDTAFAHVALPFSFPFYGKLYDGVIVRSDGSLSFLPSEADVPAAPIESSGAPKAIIAPFLADLKLSGFSSARGQVLAGPRPGGFEIQFRNLTGKDETMGKHVRLSAAVWLNERGTVEVRYAPPVVVGNPAPISISAGIKDASGSKLVNLCGQAACDSTGNPPKGTRFSPSP